MQHCIGLSCLFYIWLPIASPISYYDVAGYSVPPVVDAYRLHLEYHLRLNIPIGMIHICTILEPQTWCSHSFSQFNSVQFFSVYNYNSCVLGTYTCLASWLAPLWRSHINQLTYYYSVMWAYPIRIYVLCGYFSYHLDISRNILAYNRSILVQVTISYHSCQLQVLPHINMTTQLRGHIGVPIVISNTRIYSNTRGSSNNHRGFEPL